MFERFTPAAREVVVRAQHEARSFGHPWLGTEHLLLGVLAHDGRPASDVLGEVGVTLDRARQALGEICPSDAQVLRPGDAQALRTLGINLDEVRRHAEASFGHGALERAAAFPRPHRRLPLRRARCDGGPVTGDLRIMPRAKQALQRAACQARDRGERHIDVEHLLLGMLDAPANLALEVLDHLGADPGTVQARLFERLGRAA
jgi:ATP-dependent Clp protease ATP-binding subunit ClpA